MLPPDLFEGTTRPGYTSLVVHILTFLSPRVPCWLRGAAPFYLSGGPARFFPIWSSVPQHRAYHEPGFYSPYHLLIDSVMPLPVVCWRLPRVLRSVYIWQYNTSTVAEPLTVVSHSHLIFSEKLALDVSPFCH